MTSSAEPSSLGKIKLHEDWVSVILGFLIIGITLVWFAAPVPVFSWSTGDELANKVLSSANIESILIQFGYFFAIALAGTALISKSIKSVLVVFPAVFVLTVIALIIAGNLIMKTLNLEAVIFSLLIGLLIGNVFNLPTWFKSALTTELFVKIGLVLLGTSIVFSDILKAGSLGLIQSLVVVLAVWYFAYWLCRKLKLDEELTMMIASAVSICGVSAAIATAGAIKGDTKKLSYVISLVLIVAIPMMIIMPVIASHFNFSQEVTGAWLGGSIDTTGAVVASGTLVGEIALQISTIVKFSQNVLLGIAAFAISIYWSFTNKTDKDGVIGKPSAGLIWERFPKFVLGFMAASILFSFFISKGTVVAVKDSLKNIQTLWFVLAFTSIGLETRFSDLFNQDNRKPLFAFLTAQLFNILITLLIASILFG